MNGPWRRVDGGVEIFLRVTAKAGGDRIAGLWRGSDPAVRLAVRVAAAPEKGRANDAAIRLLAAELAMPPSAIDLTSGETDRLKAVRVRGNAALIEERLVMLLRRVQGEDSQ